jgi:Flp pilus assembly protein TadG
MLKLVTRFFGGRDGMAAVEFAFIAPVMILIFFGSLELTMAVDCRTRVNNVVSTEADLVAQATTVSTADITNTFGAVNAILYPYAAAGAQIVVSSIVDDGHGGAKVAWSNAQNATPRTVGSTVTVPAGLIVSGSGTGLILAEITYAYTSPSLVFLTGPINMKSTFYSKPRRSVTVVHT